MSADTVQTDAPQSTHDIVADVVNTAEAAAEETSAIDTAASEERQAPVTEPVKVEPAKELSIEEQLLHEFGFKDLRRPDGREHYISRSKVLQMIGSGLKRGQARWDGERTSLESKAKELEAFRDELINDVKGEDTKRFLEKIAEYNPAFRSYLQPAPQAQPAPVSEKPKPDIDLGDGRWAYSVEQNEKLVEWKAQQLFDARFKPIEDRAKAEEDRAARERADHAQLEGVRANIDKAAQAWPNFEQYRPEIEKLMFEDGERARANAKHGQPPEYEFRTLREAYLHVQNQYLAADDNAKRARWIEESNKAAKSTAVVRSGVEATKPPGPRNTKDVVRETVARLESQSR